MLYISSKTIIDDLSDLPFTQSSSFIFIFIFHLPSTFFTAILLLTVRVASPTQNQSPSSSVQLQPHFYTSPTAQLAHHKQDLQKNPFR
jgi:hypothetical protein